MAHGLISSSLSYESAPDQGSNPWLLHRQADLLPLSPQGSPKGSLDLSGTKLGVPQVKASLVAQTVKESGIQETWVRSLGQEEPLEREWQSTRYSGLETSMTEEPGGLQSTGSQRVRHG